MKHTVPSSLAKISFLSLCVSAGIAQAQQSTTPGSDEKLEEVVVTGFRGSLEQSLEVKRENVNFTDSISAEDVGKLPDNNLAEALQRVPGVQISRTNGEGQQISLRGLGPSFARVLLDGMPVSVASEGSVDQQARSREFDFDVLPSEIFSALEVSKTPRASVVEGGLSGTINLKPPRPFDYDGFKASYQVQGAYQETSQKLDPRASFLISNTWNDTFGVLLSATYSERKFRTDGWSSQGWAVGHVGPVASGTNRAAVPPSDWPTRVANFNWNLPSVTAANPASLAPGFVNESGLTNAQLADVNIPRLGRPEVQDGKRDRIGGTAAVQWKPTDGLMFTLDFLYSKLTSDFDRYTDNELVRGTSSGQAGSTGFGYITPQNFQLDADGNLVSGTLHNVRYWSENRYFEQDSDFKHLGFTTDWQISDKFNAQLKASRADSDFRWRMTTFLLLSQDLDANITTKAGAHIPSITPTVDISNLSLWDLNAVRVQPRKRNETNDNLALNFKLGDEDLNLTFGYLLNDYERERLSFGSSVGATQGAALAPFGYTGPNALASFDLTGYARAVPVNFGKGFSDSPGYSSWAVADLGAWRALMDPGALDAAANLEYTNSGTFEEKSNAFYVEANGRFDLGGHDLRANLGLRYVKTDTDMTTFTLRTPPNGALFGLRPDDYDTVPWNSSDSRLLPSLNLAYNISDSLVARFAASRTMTRPDPTQMLPFTSFSTTGTVSQGNPDLDPYISDGLDGGLEWYFTEGAVLGVTAFYKEITGFIETRRGAEPFRNANIPLAAITDPTLLSFLPNGLDSTVQFARPQNRTDVTYLKGLELLYQQRLDMILQGLGATINYTRLKSNDGLDAQGLPKVIEGLAKNNYNATVYYKPGTFALRLSYNYRGDYVECRVNCFGVTAPETMYRKAAGYLDLSSSLNFGMMGHEMTLSFEALNLTNEEEYSYFGFQNRTSIYNHPGRQYILGIRGQF